MLSVAVKDSKGKETGRVDLAPAVFEAPVRPVVVREAVDVYLANQRQGTHSTKTRHYVSGGGRKPWRQKHTGRARQGSIRAPQWRHGATAFGPLPRDYSMKLTKKKRRAALLSALSALAKEGHLIVVSDFGLGSTPRTKDMVEFLKAHDLADKKTLIITESPNEVLQLSARNLLKVKVSVAVNLNIFDLLYCDRLVMTRAALDLAQEMFGS